MMKDNLALLVAIEASVLSIVGFRVKIKDKDEKLRA
jgi:hypothetical protein